MRVAEFLGLELPAEHAGQGAESALGLVAVEGNHRAELGGEVVALPLEVAGVLRQQHNGQAFGGAAGHQLDHGFGFFLLQDFPGFIDDDHLPHLPETVAQRGFRLGEEVHRRGVQQQEHD